jgi:hypothetical protein
LGSITSQLLGISFSDKAVSFTDSIMDAADGSITLKTYTSKKTGAIILAEVSAGEALSLVADLGADPSKHIDISVTCDVTLDGRSYSADFTFTEINEDDTDGFAASLSIGGKGTASASLERSKSDGTFDFSLISDIDAIPAVDADGTLIYDEKAILFELGDIAIGGEKISDVTVRIHITSGGKVEKVPPYENILDVSVAELKENLGKNIRKLADKLK